MISFLHEYLMIPLEYYLNESRILLEGNVAPFHDNLCLGGVPRQDHAYIRRDSFGKEKFKK